MPTSLQCYYCKHHLFGTSCKAFDKIPDEIFSGKFDHKQPYPEDQGVRYEKREDRKEGEKELI